MLVYCQQNRYSLIQSETPASLLIINFEQVIEPFLVLNIFFTFFLSVVDCTFYRSIIKSNCILLLCHVPVRSSRQELFCKKGVLRNFANFTGKCLCQSLFFKKETLTQAFSSGFCEIFKNFLSYRAPLVAASGVSIVLELLARNRRNI